MMNQVKPLFISLILSAHLIIYCFVPVFGQNNPDHVEFNGYVKDLHNTWMSDKSHWISWNNIHNRINLSYQPIESVKANVGVRTNFIWGQLIREFYAGIPQYIAQEDYDPGLFDFTWVLSHDTSHIIKTQLDRLNIEFSGRNYAIKAGRQRINWGTCLVWNPNDLFNSFSYFDFDYEERPGCDALSVEYYTGSSSSAQLVSGFNHDRELSLAGLYKFNWHSYDIQLIAGKMPEDVVLGGGWAGQINGAGFRGEASCFIPISNDTLKTTVVASIDADYTLKNGTYFHVASLYNSAGTTGNAGRGAVFLLTELSVKTLSTSRLSLFAQIGYPVSPIIRADFSSIYNPYDKSIFLNPSLDFSLTENLSLLALVQLFDGQHGTEYGNVGKILYFRFKYSF